MPGSDGRFQPGEVVVLVGTRQGAALLWSDDDRRTWQCRQSLAGRAVHALAYDGRDGSLYAAINGNGAGPSVARSDDGGLSWTLAEAGLGDAGVEEVWQVQPGHPARPDEVWAGARPAGLYHSADRGQTWRPVAGLNEHPTRDTWMAGGGGLILHTILLDPGEPQRLYACISAGGAYRSDDGGATWRPINGGVPADFGAVGPPQPGACTPETGQCVHKMVLHPARPAVLFQQNHLGVYRSDDRGEQWHDISAGLSSRFGFPMVGHPHRPDSVYVVPLVSDRQRVAPGDQLAVWRTDDAGRTWRALAAGLPSGPRLTVLRESLAADDGEPAGLYLGTTSGEVYASRDAGEHWTRLTADLPPVLAVTAARVAQVHPSSRGTQTISTSR